MIGVPLTNGGSDSQDLSRTMETLIYRDGYTLFEAMDFLFPPIVNEIKTIQHIYKIYILTFAKLGDISPKDLQASFLAMQMKQYLASMRSGCVRFGKLKQNTVTYLHLSQALFLCANIQGNQNRSHREKNRIKMASGWNNSCV